MADLAEACRGNRWTDAMPAGVALLIATVWIWSGSQKLVHPDAFVEVVRLHRVFPETVIRWAFVIGLLEAGLGLGLAMTATGVPRRAHVATLSASILLTLCLTSYLLQIPGSVLASSGCGCHGTIRVSAWPSNATASKAMAITFNSVMLALRAPLVYRSLVLGRSV